MSIEQTSQLIQLILNSVLMVAACVVVLGALLVRHTALVSRLRSMNQEYFHLLSNAVSLRGDRLLQIKQQLLHLRQHHWTNYGSVLLLYYALVVLVSSTLCLSLRTLLPWQWLISVSLAFFAIGTTLFVIAVGLALLDFHTARRSLWDELNGVLRLGERPMAERRSPEPATRPMRSRLPIRRSLRSAQRPLPSRVLEGGRGVIADSTPQ